jgi:putative oxidoreductase
MNKVRLFSAILLAFPLLLFGGGYFVHPIPLPEANGQPGIVLLHALRDGGMTKAVAGGHLVCGLLLLIPWTRFLGAILHLPVTIGIVSFHAIMWRLGLPMALVMLILNLVVLSEPARCRALIGRSPKRPRPPRDSENEPVGEVKQDRVGNV